MLATKTSRNADLEELAWLRQQCSTPRIRTQREFAEQELVIPKGPFQGRRFRCDRQPYSALWLAEVDSKRWRRHAAAGMVQSGKSLLCFLLPIMYHLFEIGETVICGLPHMDMAGDKWREDLLPLIEESRYREMLPRDGGGSRGGKTEAIQFRNGATLKFMSAGGNDKSRAAYTSRVVVLTEVDGMDVSASTSREADPVTQIEARTSAYGSRSVIYMECTVSIESGRIWQEYTKGSASRVACRCPHCQGYVSPEREHLIGWKDAASLVAARQQTAFACPACGESWSESDRRQANLAARLVHRGQSIDEAGDVVGPVPETNTLGFRWSGVNNMFVTAADIGEREWNASQAVDTRNADKGLRQFIWSLPHEPESVDVTPLVADVIAARTGDTGRGVVPADCQQVTMGIDLRKRELHYTLAGWRDLARGCIAEHGVLSVKGDELGAELGVLTALRDFRDQIEAGWQHGSSRRSPDEVWIDAGWLTSVVFQFVRESNRLCGRRRYRAIIGRGVGIYASHKYNRQRVLTDTIRFIGDEYHLAWQSDREDFLVEINADYWKTWVHERLAADVAGDGSITLFDAPPREHLEFARHITAERRVSEFVHGKGEQVHWVKERPENHWLDATYIACAAAHKCGVRVTQPVAAAAQPVREVRESPFSFGSGRPFLVTER